MGAEEVSQDRLVTSVNGQRDISCSKDTNNSEETVKMKTETKCDCGYFSDNTEEMMICHQRAAEEVVIESINGQEVGKQTKAKIKTSKQTKYFRRW